MPLADSNTPDIRVMLARLTPQGLIELLIALQCGFRVNKGPLG